MSSPNKDPWLFDFVKSGLLAILFVVLARAFIAQPFIVNGQSMEPTFVENEYMIVDQVTYQLRDPSRGDVVIFRYPKNPSVYYIKRVIGLPGETVDVRGTDIHVTSNGVTFKLNEAYVEFNENPFKSEKVTLKDGEYFVLGDNRAVSADSRVWGVLPKENIVGIPAITLYPLDKISFYPGTIKFER